MVGGCDVLSSVVTSQIDLHRAFGGVVPEIAGRAHLQLLPAAIEQALAEADVDVPDAVAATTGPGLLGALVVGVSAAKALALAWDVPFVAVNHLEAHLYAAFLDEATGAAPEATAATTGPAAAAAAALHPEVTGATADTDDAPGPDDTTSPGPAPANVGIACLGRAHDADRHVRPRSLRATRPNPRRRRR